MDDTDLTGDGWRVLVCGTRTWGGFTAQAAAGGAWEPDAAERIETVALCGVLNGFRQAAKTDGVPFVLVHGACPSGADAVAAHWAGTKVKCETFPADWKNLGRRAGPIRASTMVNTLDPDNEHHLVVAAWDGESRGTGNTIEMARRRGLHIVTLRP